MSGLPAGNDEARAEGTGEAGEVRVAVHVGGRERVTVLVRGDGRADVSASPAPTAGPDAAEGQDGAAVGDAERADGELEAYGERWLARWGQPGYRPDPMAEAEAVGRLVADAARRARQAGKAGRPIVEVAEALGVSRSWLYHRHKLLDLAPVIRPLVTSGRLPVEYGILVARVPPSCQVSLATWMFFGPEGGGLADLSSGSAIRPINDCRTKVNELLIALDRAAGADAVCPADAEGDAELRTWASAITLAVALHVRRRTRGVLEGGDRRALGHLVERLSYLAEAVGLPPADWPTPAWATDEDEGVNHDTETPRSEGLKCCG